MDLEEDTESLLPEVLVEGKHIWKVVMLQLQILGRGQQLHRIILPLIDSHMTSSGVAACMEMWGAVKQLVLAVISSLEAGLHHEVGTT